MLVLAGALLAAGGSALLIAWLIRADALVWLAAANRWLADAFIHRLGYWGVFLLMFIESSFVPFPSEIIIPPAADLARRLPDWSLAAVIGLGVAGSLAGALFNYGLALYLGRPLLLRWIDRCGSYLRVTRTGYDRAEQLFLRHGAISTFTGRLLPGIRQIISLPAGLARMNLAAFSLLTALGAGLWVVVLALAGYWFGAGAESLAESLQRYTRWLALGGALLVGGYVAWVGLRARVRREPGRGSPAAPGAPGDPPSASGEHR
jgi:membrane protein DedA with SNARE-associated domain